MSVLLNPYDESEQWVEAFTRLLPNTPLDVWPSVQDPEEVEFLVAWKHPAEDLSRYPNLKAILATGAGIDQYLDPAYPDVPIIRLADPAMAAEMAAYAVHWVVHFQRRFDTYLEHQTKARWQSEAIRPASEFSVGILGYGTIGRTVGQTFEQLGYGVNAWSRSGGDDSAVTHFQGNDGLHEFLANSDAVVSVLPNTDATRGLMNAERFAYMRPHATFVNMGRGATVREDDLLAALDVGDFANAVLDVTSAEPLPAASDLWRHPRVRITPHVAGDTQASSAAALIIANINRMQNGEEPFPMYRRDRGY